ncbi:AhpC/TSA family protein [Cellulophaga baltica]|uniref:TlpA disulfide reductase family protein n=1 Tax=Cellulophaga TaxID=104264 RepID=UPI001C079ED3|nr:MULTISPECIES: TlpA disulfide reductase family protein [Cellulophaga]MBU2996379.1 AhpC/TSA family protein [Cellulophaga baltica]MDO6767775.1 TlpA disulfide reductase family protein [Cellulophaga sp. 1_MG-2023]
MKKIVLGLLTAVVLASCNSNSGGFSIEANVDGDIENGTVVYLKRISKVNQPIDVDTTTVENGKFVFKGVADSLDLQYIFIDKINGNIPVVIENGTIDVDFHKDSLQFASISGTEQNELFSKFLDNSRTFAKRAMSMREDFEKARKSNDTATQQALQEESMEMQNQAKDFELNYIKENPNAYISALLLERVYANKSLTEKEVTEIYDAFTPEIKATAVANRIKEQLEKTKKTAIGEKAPEFSAPTPNGEELALSQALGKKVTIVDFWAGWCKPCRAENPNLVRIYNKYKENGLSIVGVSLDKSEQEWKQAIEADGLEWNHVSNVQYFDEIAQSYNVRAIPATFILDENGVIIAKDLRGEALESKIEELVGKI